MAEVQKLHFRNDFLQRRKPQKGFSEGADANDGSKKKKQSYFPSFDCVIFLNLSESGWHASLTTDLSMALMLLWLMSSVVRVLQTGMTAVIGQLDNSPSASHWENSIASGTSIDCRQPEQISYLVHQTTHL